MRTTLLMTLIFAASLFAATPAEIAIRQASAQVEKQPAYFGHYNDLAAAYAQRARETSDERFYLKAEEALRKSFALAPDNFDGLKVEAWLQLGAHEFAKALKIATRLNQMAPDDVMVYGYMADADMELGNYKDAVTATQWMLNLRDSNVPGLTRAATLRELHGDLNGALDLLHLASDRVPPDETEERARLLAQRSHVELLNGELLKAGATADEALAVFPGYDPALAALSHVRLAQKRYADAVALLRQRYDAAPRTSALYELAEAQELAGQKDDAAESFRKFEQQALAQSAQAENSNRELILYFVDHAQQPAKALELARREVALRQDVFTLDAYAWALAGTGDYRAAHAQLAKPLEMGVKDPTVLRHAGALDPK